MKQLKLSTFISSELSKLCISNYLSPSSYLQIFISVYLNVVASLISHVLVENLISIPAFYNSSYS